MAPEASPPWRPMTASEVRLGEQKFNPGVPAPARAFPPPRSSFVDFACDGRRSRDTLECGLWEDCMSYDLVIKGGTVVDGTGAKRYRADVAIAGGKVAEIGKVTEGAKRTIDADGLVVAPGFVDPHTHY